jgi:hypothetical protein
MICPRFCVPSHAITRGFKQLHRMALELVYRAETRCKSSGAPAGAFPRPTRGREVARNQRTPVPLFPPKQKTPKNRLTAWESLLVLFHYLGPFSKVHHIENRHEFSAFLFVLGLCSLRDSNVPVASSRCELSSDLFVYLGPFSKVHHCESRREFSAFLFCVSILCVLGTRAGTFLILSFSLRVLWSRCISVALDRQDEMEWSFTHSLCGASGLESGLILQLPLKVA